MNKKSGAGKYDKRVEIWGKTKTINDLKQDDYQGELIKTIWAKITPQTGKLQTQAAETVLSNTSHKIVCRYSAGKAIKADDWIVFKGDRYDINYILNPYEANEEIEIFAERLKG